ncbi:113_t:CDS:1 [Funneliformis mosseae]|uniref:113_t:CDS:1 n=1 Tax=Funneliformis mosseae TaxID=27381 RepID=A0A9N9FN43_FUNMO|nr:113_t:CDS:1 [Funneliformis mosseae]
MNERQIATTPILLLTNQQSLSAVNEAANLNQYEVSATNANEFASDVDFDQANSLVVSKRNVIPYAVNNAPILMIKRDIIPNSEFRVQRDVVDQDKRNMNENTGIEKRLVGIGPTFGLVGTTGATIAGALPYFVDEDILGGTGSVNGLVANRGSFASANAIGF